MEAINMASLDVSLTGASAIDREKTDFYRTPLNVTIALLRYLNLQPGTSFWECACGEGHMVDAILDYANEKYYEYNAYDVYSTDLYDRGRGVANIDFLKEELPLGCNFIITNPPFSESEKFIRHALTLNVPFAFLLKSQYWHSSKRRSLFEQHKPFAVLPLTWRPDFLFGAKSGSPNMEVLWTVWIPEPAKNTLYTPLERPK